ncbi:methyl-accepting chemotaxis protein [Desulfohalovibrio reitneri]|uniref:methyl-accepting chemotaxis protein n=1 Tax=Desulfohalovibrio reitneri TaxID=1307759 RepID=UPI0004A73871|nr:Cache 3/Cache 2 fusion domain-containing protein [Desulfohalovibrio reitneri]
MRNRISLNAKLVFGLIGLVVLTIVVLTSINLWQAKNSLENFAHTTVRSVAESVMRDLEGQNSLTQEKVSADLALLQQILDANGIVRTDDDNMETMTVTNQVTSEKEQVTMPTLKAGYSSLYDPSIVDKLQEMVGGTATIFQLHDDKLIRVSTNVLKLDGERATGTYIPSSSPVFKTIMKGETFRGRAYVVNQWYITAYKPLTNIAGKIVGVAYVGRRIVTPEVKNTILNADIQGEGYAYAVAGDGTFLVHPDEEIVGTKASEVGLGDEFMDADDEFFRYTFKGEPKTAYVHHFKPWDWHVAVGMDDKDMLLGADKRMLTASSLGAVGMLALSVVLAFIILRVISKPLRQLESYTSKVAEGDFTASIDYQANDAVSRTIESVRNMVEQIKQRLGFAQGILEGMPMPCVVVAPDEKVTYGNQKLMDLLGRDTCAEDCYGQTAGELLYGDSAKETLSRKALKERDHQEREVSYTSQAGKELQLAVSSTPIYDLDGELQGAFTTYYDLTEIRAQEQRIREQNERIARVASQAGEIAEQVSSASQELSSQVEQASRGAEQQSERVQETASSMEEMNATVLEVARNATEASGSAEQAMSKAKHGEDVVKRVITSIEGVRDQTEGLRGNMNKLGEQAQSIGEVITVIEDIADQTNLLALNAAIEAARAGDAGRGFAVVADEVRKLAEKTMNATKEVGEAIAAIQKGAETSVEATQSAAKAVVESTELAEESGQALGEIVSIVEGTASQVSSIATAAEQQSATSEEINRAVEDINRISSETAQGMQESARAVSDLAQRSSELMDLMDELRKE